MLVVRAAMVDGLETVALTKRQETDVKTFSLPLTRTDRITNE